MNMSNLSYFCSRKCLRNLCNFKYFEKYTCIKATFCQNTQSKNTDNELSIVDELPVVDLALEEEIEKKRNKNRLPSFVYKVHVQKEVPDLIFKYDFHRKRLRRHFGHYGKSSKLNPGILWPTEQELEDIKEFEANNLLSLQQMLDKVKAEKQAIEEEKLKYEEEVEKNLENYVKWEHDYHEKNAKIKAQAEELKKKREQLIEEISEYLGYPVDSKDPRFKDAVELREREKKRSQKEKREKESYAKMLKKLSEIAENQDK